MLNRTEERKNSLYFSYMKKIRKIFVELLGYMKKILYIYYVIKNERYEY